MAHLEARPGHDPRLVGARTAYGLIVMLGYRQNPRNTLRAGKRGRIGQGVARNLLTRLGAQREEVLRFACDLRCRSITTS